MTQKALSKKELDNINRRLAKLDALEAAGVNSWSRYEESLKEWNRQQELSELMEEFIEELNEIFVDGVDYDFPAGREAGISITVSEYGEELFIGLLKRYSGVLTILEKK